MFVSSHHITRSASCYLYLYTYTSRTSAISLITLYSNNSVCSSGHAGCAVGKRFPFHTHTGFYINCDSVCAAPILRARMRAVGERSVRKGYAKRWHRRPHGVLEASAQCVGAHPTVDASDRR